jgi:hypothetical protein
METKYKGIDINPSNMKHILTGYGGGLPQLIIDTGKLIYNTAKGNDIQTGEIPFLRKVVRTYDDKKAYTSEYWDLKNKVDNYKTTLKDASKNSSETYAELILNEKYRDKDPNKVNTPYNRKNHPEWFTDRYKAYVKAQAVLDGIEEPKKATEFSSEGIKAMIEANKMMNLTD